MFSIETIVKNIDIKIVLPGDAVTSSDHMISIHQRTATTTGSDPNVRLEYKIVTFYFLNKKNVYNSKIAVKTFNEHTHVQTYIFINRLYFLFDFKTFIHSFILYVFIVSIISHDLYLL